jgi:hypothetical protein
MIVKLFAALVAFMAFCRLGMEMMKDTQGAIGYEQTDTPRCIIPLVLGVLALYVLGWAAQ